jgi:cysteine desulfurase/selenocysteine lyase
MFEIQKIRSKFPILDQKVYEKPLVYFDNGATTQKPDSVIKRVQSVYTEQNSNIHRGVHFLSTQMTEMYEASRDSVRQFIHAEKTNEIVFTKGTTDSINLAAFTFGERYITEGDQIMVAQTEHHSNIVPWQILCKRKKAVLKVIPVSSSGEIDLEAYKTMLSKRTRLVTFAHVVNSLGVVNPVKEMTEAAHEAGAKVLIDGAQAIQHFEVNVQDLDCDFYAFSGHKLYAPTGIGVLYGKEALLNELPPYQGGGDMIKTVSFEHTEYADLPLKFEAGTPHYAGAVGLGEAIKFIDKIGLDLIHKHESDVMDYASTKLLTIKGLRIYGYTGKNASIISFLLDGIHFYDTGVILDKLGIAVRTGTHCAEPTMKHFGILGTVRASFAMYNTKEEVDILYDGLLRVKKMFS